MRTILLQYNRRIPKNRLRRISFLLLWVLAVIQTHAQTANGEVSVRAAIDTGEIKIGEQFHLVLQAVSDSAGADIVWAAIPDTFNHLMVVSRSPIDTSKNNDQIIYQQKYTLTGFDSGRWYIPSFQFHTISEEDSSAPETLKTDSFPILIHSVAVDTTKPFKPIKEIRAVPFNLWDYWPYLLAALVALLIILFFVFVYKKRSKPLKEKVIPQEPPYDQAVEALKILEKEKLWQKGEVKEYYSRLTDILRLYIQRQYRINAMEQTSDELLDKIRPVTRLNQQRDQLQYILQMADLAKFAKLQPLPEEHERCMDKANSFVEWTRPQPEKEDNKPEK